jgi:hypothetical protein
MSDPTLAVMKLVSAESLGGPAAPEPEKCSASAILALMTAAGPGMRLTSLALDIASHVLADGMVEIATRVEKRAKSIVFASVEARMGAAMVFSAQGLLTRVR